MTPRRNFKTPQERLAAFQEAREDGCIVYTGRLDGDGYARIGVRGRMTHIHRFTWEQANGPIPDGLLVDHICHVRNCFNLAHLRLATPSQNQQNHPGRTVRPVTASGVRGVWRDHTAERWVAQVNSGGRPVFKRYFVDLDEAAEAARLARIKFHTHNDLDRRAG